MTKDGEVRVGTPSPSRDEVVATDAVAETMYATDAVVETKMPANEAPLSKHSAGSVWRQSLDDESCTLMVTVADLGPNERMTRQDAYNWALQNIRKATHAEHACWQGQLISAIPVRSTVAGRLIKLKFVGVPESLMSSVIIPGLEKDGQVDRMSKDEEAYDRTRAQAKGRDKRKRVQAIGNVAAVNSTVERLLAMRGTGGSEKQRRKFVDAVANMLDRSYKIGSADLRELREEPKDNEE